MDHNVDNLIEIEKEIQLKVSESNNMFKMPTIIAVSKTFSISDILPVINYGQIHFGENKIQEAIDKWESIKIDFKHIKLHMVGKLQTNKVKYLIPFFAYLHSLDNIKLAQKISYEQKKKKKKLKIFKKKIKKKFEIISVVADKNLINLRKVLLKNANK